MPGLPARPFGRAYWVVPGKFLAGCFPGELELEVATAKLVGLLEVEIRCVIALTGAHESGRGGLPFADYEPILKELAEARGIRVEVHRHPIADMGVPTAVGMRRTLDAIDAALAAGQPVYVHCWGGYGRTGTVVGCWLARHGYAAGAAVLERIAELRAGLWGASPQTDAQCAMVVGWQAGE